MILKILLTVCFLLFFIFVPLYDRAYWPQPTKKSLAFKMIAATMFVLIGVFGMLIAQNRSDYAFIMLNGLILGWIGDFLLHIPHKEEKPNMILFYAGAVAFLIGHLFYAFVFVKTTAVIEDDFKLITLPEVIAFFIIAIVFSLMLEPVFKFKYDNAFMKIALHLYGIFLIIMLIKSCKFGIAYFQSGANGGFAAMLLLLAGGVLFFISDLTLGLRLLGSGKGSKKIKQLSLYTYFFAQLSLATSILFINIG